MSGGKYRRWLLGAGLGLLALVTSGCQMRPRFKVTVSDIDEKTTSLLVSLWLGNAAVSGLSTAYTDVAAQSPPSGFTQFDMINCDPADKSCNPKRSEYSFGVYYDLGLNANRHTAIVGVAGIDSARCYHNVLTGVISDPAEYGDPETLPLSFLLGSVENVDTASCTKGGLVVTEVISEFDARITGVQPVLLLVVNGWGFAPDSILDVNDGCGAAKIYQSGTANQTTQAATILSVTPTQIIAQAGTNLLRSSCVTGMLGTKTVTVINNPTGASTPSNTFVFIPPASR